MAPRRCCCYAGCEIGRDEFNRANAATLGAGWDDPDSAWSIDSNEALSTAAGVARFLTPHPVPDESMVVYFETRNEVDGSGRKWRVLVNMLDEDNYHYVEFERNGANDSVLRLGKVTAGVGTVLKSDTIVGLTNTSRQVIAKISPLEFCGTVSNAVLSFVGDKPSLITNGIYSGIEALASGTRLDRHIFEHHRHTLDQCGNCLCLCETEYIPPVLLATFTNCTNRMASLDGATMLLNWERLNGRWIGTSNLCTPGQVWTLTFFCPSDENDGSTASMGVSLGCNSSDGFGTAARSPASYTCDPLEWVFGGYNVGPLDLACGCGSPDFSPGAPSGSYTIVITEAP